MKIVFFGTPEYVIPILEGLRQEYNKPNRERQLIAVVTQAPKEIGREKIFTRTAVDNWGFKHNIPVIFDFNEIPEADLGILASFGQILPNDVINQFPLGILNIHPSLLPKFRGASPVQATILEGIAQTGLTILKMDEAMDHGPIVTQVKEEVLETDTNESLRNRLFEKAVPVLIDLLPPFIAGKIRLKEQKHDEASFTRLIAKQDGFVPPSILSDLLKGKKANQEMEIPFIKNFVVTPDVSFFQRLMKALSPWPGVWTNVEIKGIVSRLKILESHIDENKLVIDKVQLEGKNEVTWAQFEQGYPEAKI